MVKAKLAIEVASGENLIADIQTVKAAVEAGILDAQFEAASGRLKAVLRSKVIDGAAFCFGSCTSLLLYS